MIGAVIGWAWIEEAIEKSKIEAQRLGWTEPASSLWHAREYGLMRVEFSDPDADHGFGGGSQINLAFGLPETMGIPT